MNIVVEGDNTVNKYWTTTTTWGDIEVIYENVKN
jgi:hypothetical protein